MESQQALNNLAAAREAVQYVKGKVKLGAANNPFKLQTGPVSQLKAMGALLKVRDGEDKDMEAMFVNPADVLRVAQTFATNAEKFGAGNCGEQSAMAYLRLRSRAITPIDWVQFNNKDHAFVLIGRTNRGAYTAGAIIKQSWFSDVVVCDAYWNRADYWKNLLADYDPKAIAVLLHQESPNELHQWINK